jgi:hypothetical protein
MVLNGLADRQQRLGLFQEALEVGFVAGTAEVVDADLGAVADVVKGNGLARC